MTQAAKVEWVAVGPVADPGRVGSLPYSRREKAELRCAGW